VPSTNSSRRARSAAPFALSKRKEGEGDVREHVVVFGESDEPAISSPHVVVFGESDEPLSSETERSHGIKGRGIINQSAISVHARREVKRTGGAVHINSFSPARTAGVEGHLRRPSQPLGQCQDICHCSFHVVVLHLRPSAHAFGARSAEFRLGHLAFPTGLLGHVAAASSAFHPSARCLGSRCVSRRSGMAILWQPFREGYTLSGAERPLWCALSGTNAASHHRHRRCSQLGG
jgi:hypothetical protein